MSVLGDLATVIASDGFSAVAPVITAALADVHANPDQWTSPISAPLKVLKLQADLAGALPGAQNVSVADAAAFLSVFWAKVLADLAAKAAKAKASLTAANATPAAAS
jgi:hypothetical protein